MNEIIDDVSILLAVVTFFYAIKINELNELLNFDTSKIVGNNIEKEKMKRLIKNFIRTWIFTVLLPIFIVLPSFGYNIFLNISNIKDLFFTDITVSCFFAEIFIYILLFCSCFYNLIKLWRKVR